MTDFIPPIRPETPVGRRGDNIYALIGNARRFARQLGWPRAWIEEFSARVTSTGSYDEALAEIGRYFAVADGDEP